MSRLLRKHVVLDQEKQARQQDMRRSGVPVGKRVDIPFGVRAIQSGIEVDGIWISRPGTPVESETLIGSVGEAKGKEKAVPISGGVRSPRTAVTEVQPTPGQSPTPSLLEHNEAVHAPLRSIQVGPQSTYRPTHAPYHQSNTSTETTRLGSLRQLEGDSARPPRLEIYTPTMSWSTEQHGSYRPRERGSGSSDSSIHENLAPVSKYQDRFPVPPQRKRSPFEDPEPSSPTLDFLESGDYFQGTPEQRNPFESGESERTPSRESQAASHRPNNSYGSTDMQIRLPQRSYSGETHVNTSSRRVNAGFEVLPAGTFSSSDNQADVEGAEWDRSRNRHSNKLQKKGHDRP
ncbi:hypothetical protein DL764_002530 [Monosporascus ibericus]|uniref:Uncharacterized protein n=1 Tax=Monosporascus ibericus TaxID=155417 RepID=A0A4Q4TK30_9PEZI|nr:hypothetical protein DL764_002530 [Monosporascus ibericus]